MMQAKLSLLISHFQLEILLATDVVFQRDSLRTIFEQNCEGNS
jgi:hypothetical protein